MESAIVTRVIVVTGLPGSGKTTLARELAARWRLPLLAKDLIKEPLMDILGAADAAQSRRLSDASFAVLFDVARGMVAVGSSFLLEGNFRAGEHEASLMRALNPVGSSGASSASVVRIAQVLCRVPEAERFARLQSRADSGGRHAGHRLGEQASARVSTDAFLEVPSKRLIHTGDDGRTVHDALDDWMNLSAPSP